MTDHAPIELDINLRFEVKKPHINEAYNFKKKTFMVKLILSI